MLKQVILETNASGELHSSSFSFLLIPVITCVSLSLF